LYERFNREEGSDGRPLAVIDSNDVSRVTINRVNRIPLDSQHHPLMLIGLVDVDDVSRLRVIGSWEVERRSKDETHPDNPPTVSGEADLMQCPENETSTPIFAGTHEGRLSVSPVLVPSDVAKLTDGCE
jgi:hypothetical protein